MQYYFDSVIASSFAICRWFFSSLTALAACAQTSGSGSAVAQPTATFLFSRLVHHLDSCAGTESLCASDRSFLVSCGSFLSLFMVDPGKTRVAMKAEAAKSPDKRKKKKMGKCRKVAPQKRRGAPKFVKGNPVKKRRAPAQGDPAH